MSDQPAPGSADLLSAALRHVTSHALILLDPQGVIVDWLAGAERILGYRPDEAIGQDVAILFTPEDLQKDLSTWEMRTAVATGESEDDRWQVRKDGGRFFASGTLTALRDEQGKLIGFVKILRDRTDQKSRYRALEGRVAAHRQAEEHKNVFISTLGHELRNPLAAIRYTVEALKVSESTSPEVKGTLETIAREVEFMRRLISDLLDAARAAAGKLRLRTEAVVLQEVIHAALATSRQKVEARNQHLEHVLPEVPIQMIVDPLRLQQVLVNLIDNASKYTPEGGRIWVTGTIEGSDAVIRVKDTGQGIAPDVMPHIFDLFTQADPTHHAQVGLGIGLSVVRDLVTLHGGTVQAMSEGVGKGSEFIVRLKLPPAESSQV